MIASDVESLYVGGAGEFLVMSELMARGYNVAVPRVDTGNVPDAGRR